MSAATKTSAAAEREEGRTGASPSPPPDALLKALYKSERPAVDLLPGVGLSPIINGCWLSDDARVLLSGNWMAEPSAAVESEDPAAENAALPPAFNPSAPEYTSLQHRLSKSAAMQQWNALTIKLALATAASREKGLEEREQQLKQQQVDIARTLVQEAEVLLGDLKASFLEDPLALLPWMQTLFDLADAGLTTFDVSGAFWPYTQLRSLFSTDNTASYYEGAEKILGLFKRRYERERGKDRIQILTRLVPNIFHEGYSPAVVETLVDRMRANVYTAEAPEPLDLLQLVWWDLQAVDPEAASTPSFLCAADPEAASTPSFLCGGPEAASTPSFLCVPCPYPKKPRPPTPPHPVLAGGGPAVDPRLPPLRASCVCALPVPKEAPTPDTPAPCPRSGGPRGCPHSELLVCALPVPKEALTPDTPDTLSSQAVDPRLPPLRASCGGPRGCLHSELLVCALPVPKEALTPDTPDTLSSRGGGPRGCPHSELLAVDVLPTLKALQQLTEDKMEPGADGAEEVLLEPRRVKGLALVDFPASALLAALQAGVPVVSVQLPHSLGERGHSKTLGLAKEYGIKVVARDGLMGGLVSPKYVGAPCPDALTPDADLESIPYAVDLINNYGGWERVQELLVTVASVAAKHGVKMQTVALRWQIDQGTFPLVTTRWGSDSWRNYGHSTAGKNNEPGIDAALFQKASFLDASDAELLARLAPS
ncbi:MAG: hypothetical protein WDW36_000775 [Sanguina aurantia]